MPTEHVYTDLALRLDGNDPAALIEFLTKDGGAFLVVRELENSNPHFHALVHTKRKLPAFRSAFVRAVQPGNGYGGNGAYSISIVKDLDKYERYCCKGASSEEEPQVTATNGVKYSAEWISLTHARYWQENQAIKEARKKLSMQDFVVLEARDKAVRWDDKKGLALIYIRELARRDKPINIFSLRSNINLIQVKLCPDDTAIEELATSVSSY